MITVVSKYRFVKAQTAATLLGTPAQLLVNTHRTASSQYVVKTTS